MGLGDGVASAEAEGEVASVGPAEGDGDGEAGDASGLEAEAEGGGGVDGEVGDPDDDGAPDPLAAVGGVDPVGVVVHPASTPAHSRALSAIAGRFTTSG